MAQKRNKFVMWRCSGSRSSVGGGGRGGRGDRVLCGRVLLQGLGVSYFLIFTEILGWKQNLYGFSAVHGQVNHQLRDQWPVPRIPLIEMRERI